MPRHSTKYHTYTRSPVEFKKQQELPIFEVEVPKIDVKDDEELACPARVLGDFPTDFRAKINSALEKHNILRSDLIHAMNQISRVNQNTVYNYLSGKSELQTDNLEVMLQAMKSLGAEIKL